MSGFKESKKKKSLIKRVAPHFPVIFSALFTFTVPLVKIWQLLREKFTLDQLKGIPGSIGSIFITFISAVQVGREIGIATAECSKGLFRPDLPSPIRSVFYSRYLGYRFALLSAYLLAMTIAVGEIYILSVGVLSGLLIPSFILGITLFIGCQVIDIFRLNDEWRYASSWEEREDIENRLITTWVALILLIASFTLGLLGFSFVSTTLLIGSGIVFILKVANALIPKEPIKKFFDFIRLPLFKGVDSHDLYPEHSLLATYSRLRSCWPREGENEEEMSAKHRITHQDKTTSSFRFNTDLKGVQNDENNDKENGDDSILSL